LIIVYKDLGAGRKPCFSKTPSLEGRGRGWVAIYQGE